MPTKLLAAAVVAAATWFAGSASAAPLPPLMGLGHDDASSVEQVQYRRWHRRAYRNGYYAYGSAPRRWNYGNGSAATAPGSWRGCPGGDRHASSGYPSWMCR
jgi:hypothetical protein